MMMKISLILTRGASSRLINTLYVKSSDTLCRFPGPYKRDTRFRGVIDVHINNVRCFTETSRRERDKRGDILRERREIEKKSEKEN